MDAMLQRHCARYIYIVPDGLRELMTDISREVIRSQPENIYTFIADYLDALMITRENARVAARLVQSVTEISENIIEMLQRAGISKDNAERIANVMEAAFRKYLDIKIGMKAEDITEEEMIQEIINNAGITQEEADRAARIIQQGYRVFKEKKDKEKELLTGMIDWRVAARSAIQLYRRTGVTNEEANRAATMIKAAYKGYYTRKFMKRLAEEAAHLFDLEDSEDSGSSTTDTREGAADSPEPGSGEYPQPEVQQDESQDVIQEQPDMDAKGDTEDKTEMYKKKETREDKVVNKGIEEEDDHQDLMEEIRVIMEDMLDQVFAPSGDKYHNIDIMDIQSKKSKTIMDALEGIHDTQSKSVVVAEIEIPSEEDKDE